MPGAEITIILGISTLVLGIVLIVGSAFAKARVRSTSMSIRAAQEPVAVPRRSLTSPAIVRQASSAPPAEVEPIHKDETPKQTPEDPGATPPPESVAVEPPPSEPEVVQEPDTDTPTEQMDVTPDGQPVELQEQPLPETSPAYTDELGELEDEDEVTEEEEARSRVILLIGIPAVPLPGPFWRTYSVKNEEEALWRLDQTRCDVVLIDIKTDAEKILKKVARNHPHLPRIVRCDEEGPLEIRKVVPSSQDITRRTATEEEFFHTLERATAIDLGDLSERMRKHLGPISSLPALPDNYQRIRRVIGNPNGSVRQIAAVIVRDIGLTTRVLQVVNSPLYGLRQPVTDVAHAATLLGMRGIRDLTLTLEVFGYFSSKIPMGGVTVEDLYEYSLKVATVAQRIGKIHADDAYTAALLHQIGRLILMTKLPDKYQDSLDAWASTAKPLRDAQRAIIGIDQDETSAYLLSVWGLPQRVIEAVAFFDAPSLVPHTSLDVVDVLHVAVSLVSEHHGERHLPLDEVHLDTMGASEYIEEWRELALEVCPPPVEETAEEEEGAEE